MDENKIYTSLQDILQKIDKIDNDLNFVNSKLCNLEEKVENMNNMQSQPTQIAMMTTVSSSDDKIKILNERTDANKQEDLLVALSSKCIVTNSGIFSILDNTITIYEYIADVVHTFDDESHIKYICGISDGKNNLFFWNQTKKTWAKLTKSYLQEIFMAVQQQIIIKYNKLMNEDNALKKGNVENGDLIFADDFEKKHAEFKKFLISKFI